MEEDKEICKIKETFIVWATKYIENHLKRKWPDIFTKKGLLDLRKDFIMIKELYQNESSRINIYRQTQLATEKRLAQAEMEIARLKNICNEYNKIMDGVNLIRGFQKL